MKNIIALILLLPSLALGANGYVDANGFRNLPHTKSYLLPTIAGSSDSILTRSDTSTLTNKSMSGSANTFTLIPYSALVLTGSVLNADLAGSIADSKLSTITTAGKVSNSATTATNANTPSAIVARDGSGNFTAGIITATLSGNATSATTVTTNANLTGPITSTGNATAIASQTGTGTTFVMNTSPTLVTPNLGTPSALIATNASGTASGLTAGTVTTNANLTGPITSVGNATSVAAQTGTGSTFVMQTSPTLTTPNLGTPSALVGTNISGTASGLTAGNVTTNANLTGPVTSTGNATAIANGAITQAMTDATSTPTASKTASYDANSNLSAVNLIDGWATTATAGGTTVLTVGSAYQQTFTGTLSQTVTLPVASTLVQGQQYQIVNASSGTITVNSSGGNLVTSVGPGTAAIPSVANLTCILTSGTTAASWSAPAAGGTTSPLSTKGDVYTWSTTNARHAVPADYGRMIPDSGATDGWRNVTSSQLQQGRPGKNYIQYADFENNATTGWTASGCGTITNGLPACVGSGAAAFSSSNGGATKGANTSAPAIDSGSNVSGTYALNLATTGAGTVGDGYVSSAYTIDKSDQAKVLTYRLAYKVASGTPVMAGTSANTYAVAVYDVANNAWLGVAGAFNFVQSTGVGVATGTFQTASNTTSIQLFIYSPVAPTGASSLLIDDVYVGPQALATGASVGDFQVCPTGFASSWVSNTTTTCKYRRIGDHVELEFNNALIGSPTAANLTFTYPTAFAIDSTKLTGGATSTFIDGECAGNRAGAGVIMRPFYSTSTSTNILYLNSITTASGASVTASAPVTWASGDNVTCRIRYPVAGWSSNSVQSSDTATNVVALNILGQLATGTISNSASVTKLATVTLDTAGGYSASTGLYTVPVTGWYSVSGTVDVSAVSAAVTNYVSAGIQKNSSTQYENFVTAGSTSNNHLASSVTGIVFCNAGDTLNLDARSNMTTPTYSNGLSGSFLTINRLSGPAVISATESVNASYTNTSAQSIASGGTLTTITGWTKDWDSHNAFSTSGVFTCPVSGKYQVSGNLVYASNAFVANKEFDFAVVQAGSVSKTRYLSSAFTQASATTNINLTGSADFNCLAGDTLTVQTGNGSTGAIALSSAANLNHIEIKRVGN